MRIMPFSVLKNKLINRSKCQTIRTDKETNYYNVGECYKAVFNARRSDRQVLGTIKVTAIEKILGSQLTETDAMLDSVNSLTELLDLLKKLNGRKELNELRLLIISYEWL